MRHLTRFSMLLPAALVAAGALGLGPSDAHGQAYLKLPGIDGDVTERGHEGWMAIESFHWGGAAQRGRVSLSTVKFRKHYDMGSPYLKRACEANTRFPEAVLSVRERGATGPSPYTRYVLRNVTISACDPASGDRPIESMTLNFSPIEVRPSGEPEVTGGTRDRLER